MSLLSSVCVCALSKEGIIYGARIIVTIKREVNIFMDFFMGHFNCIQLFLMSWLLDENLTLLIILTNIVNRGNAKIAQNCRGAVSPSQIYLPQTHIALSLRHIQHIYSS